MLTPFLLSIVAVCVTTGAESWAADRPSKRQEANSIQTAQTEMKRISGFDDGKQYELFRCEQWFYDTLSDGNNFAKLRQGDKDRVKKIVGERPFFLHRFTPLEKKGVVYEIFVSHDGASVVGSRMQVVESGQK